MDTPGLTAAFTERWLTAQDGLRLYWRDYGDPLAPGLPVLCLSGLTRNSKDFHDLATHLCGGRRVICPDYRGRGRSQYDPDWRHYEPRTYLDDLRHLVAAAGVHRFAVIGTSLGGILAMALRAMMPTAVAGAVLNDVGPDVAQGGLDRIIDYIGRDRPQPDLGAAEAHLQAVLPNLTFRGGNGWRKLTENTFRPGEDGLLHFDWDIRIVEPLRRSKPGDMPPLWPLFRGLAGVPVLVVRGGRSDVLTAECLAAMAAAMPDMAQVVVPDTGHAPALDEDEVVAAIDALLKRVDAPAGSHICLGQVVSG